MSKSLVIVESPSKAKTINKYLGSNYIVEATVGHVKNLPKSKMSVEIDKNYEAVFEVIKGKEKVIKSLKSIAKTSDKIYIATDPDREGEAIADDIADEIVSVNNKIHRVLFNEITKSGVSHAMENPRNIDKNLVSSQTARRVMDRILGYKLSPFLWKTFYYGLSAGRVQSVALKLICEREKEIRDFIPKEYWSIHGIFSKPSGNTKSFAAKLYKINEDTLKFNGEKPCIENIDQAHKIVEELRGNKFKITDIQVKSVKRNPPAPFTTSVLQQAASTRLGFSPKKTMMLAQKLYEGIEVEKGEGNVGLITYMRTDSTRISPEAVHSAREFIEKNYGKEYIPEKAKIFSTKGKTQDAHEAIRPSDVLRKPELMKKLGKDLHALYTLIWKRFVASQMTPAVFDQKTVILKALSPTGGKAEYFFKATGSELIFSGFLKVYEYANGNNTENDKEELSVIPPDIKIDDLLKALSMAKEQHFTIPPPRYNESSLIKQLDNLGIGRPSTFAYIVSTVIDRKYVDLIERKLYATNLGMKVDEILGKHFSDVINAKFTAKMEDELDTIANGEATYKKVLDDFYIPFSKDLEEADGVASDIKKMLTEKTDIDCPECGAKTSAKMVKKWGRNGQFLACEKYPTCKASMPLKEEQEEHDKIHSQRKVICDLCGADMQIKIGRYGKFFGCTNYPKCKGVKPVTLGIKCPKCNEGELVQRRGGKRKSLFYGCTKYPDCDFLTNAEPVIQTCSKCNNNYLVKKSTKKDGDFLQCPECKEKYELEASDIHEKDTQTQQD